MSVVPAFTLVGGLVAVVLVTRFRQGQLLSPMSVALLMLTAIFGVRPLLMASAGAYDFYGGSAEQGFQVASNVGFVAVAAMCVGYLLALSRTRKKGLDTRELHATSPNPRSITTLRVRFKLALAVAGSFVGFWFLIMAFVGGGFSFIGQLFAGRSADVILRLENVPSIVPALPVVAALIAANARVVTERERILIRGERIAYWLVILMAVVPPAALGTRRFLIPSLVAGAIGVVAARWGKRVSLRMLAILASAFVVLAILPFVRSAGSRTGRTDLAGAIGDYFSAGGLQGVLDGFFLSYDTEMFSYISYVAPTLGESIPYGMGRLTIVDILISPIPASLSPFSTWSNEILTRLFGGGCAEVFCPVPSLPGALYFDFGFIGVAIGMFAVGWAMSRFEDNFLSASGARLTALLTLAAFTIQIVRGNPASQIWIAFQVFILVALAMRFSSTRTRGARLTIATSSLKR